MPPRQPTHCVNETMDHHRDTYKSSHRRSQHRTLISLTMTATHQKENNKDPCESSQLHFSGHPLTKDQQVKANISIIKAQAVYGHVI
jgi:hypothetical protein